MKSMQEIIKSPGVYKVVSVADDGAMFYFRWQSRRYEIIASDGGGWDHVSVVPVGQSSEPTWKAMCAIKDLCFRENEVVMQLHPATKDCINLVHNCLHLWRPQDEQIPLPPKLFV